MRIVRPLAFLSCILLSAVIANAQQLPAPASPGMDSESSVVISKALAALGAPALRDVTLAGSAHEIMGSDDQTGTVSLKAIGPNMSRIDLALSGGTAAEIRNLAMNGRAVGNSVAGDGGVHSISAANCFTPAAWFSPSLLLERAMAPGFKISFQGQENRSGVTVFHLRAFAPYNFVSGRANVPRPIQLWADSLSALDIYLDTSSYFPVAVTFCVHPDKTPGIDIPVEIDFSDYRNTNGVPMPFHIQKKVNGVLELDVAVNSATENSGLNPADFAVQ